MNSRIPIKEKKSFTLSRSSVAYLERLRREKKAPSTSRVLDELIRDAAARHQRSAAEQAISAYYSLLSSGEEKEQKAWGEFAEDQLREQHL